MSGSSTEGVSAVARFISGVRLAAMNSRTLFLESAFFGVEGKIHGALRSGLNGTAAERGVTAIMMGAAAEQRVEGEQPLEIGADVEFLGDAHGAMKLDRLFGDEARAFADLTFAPEAARLRATGSASPFSAARNAIERASSHCIAMSARRCRITWLADSGRPNCFRIFVYSSVWSSRVCMMPTASAPSAAIARSTAASIAGKASLPSPSRASAGSGISWRFEIAGPPAAKPRKVA